MNRDELLKARGWVRHGAGLDLWCPPGAPDGSWVDGDEASRVQVLSDRRHVVADGSVRFYPTAEQAQTSPLLAACAARGMCEREVIDQLARENARLTVEVQSLAEMVKPSTVVLSDGPMLKQAQAIGAAWEALARAYIARDCHDALVSRLRGGSCDGAADAEEENWTLIQRQIADAKDALRALGVDPDADDEPGQVAT